MKLNLMRKIIFSLIIVSALSTNAFCQSLDCRQEKFDQVYLELDGSNSKLIDNAMRLFTKSSIGNIGDSLLRIWILEDSYPDTPVSWTIKMFEIGHRLAGPTAEFHTMRWECINDSTFPVRCVTSTKLYPNSNWTIVDGKIRRNSKILETYRIENNVVPLSGRDYGLIMLQFIFGQTTKTFDFSNSVNLYSPLDGKQSAAEKSFVNLLLLIERYFNIRLSRDGKGRDFLQRKIQGLITVPEVKLEPPRYP